MLLLLLPPPLLRYRSFLVSNKLFFKILRCSYSAAFLFNLSTHSNVCKKMIVPRRKTNRR
jgi:hypothetical protein